MAYPQDLGMQAAQQQGYPIPGGLGPAKSPKERNPESVTGRLDQIIYGANAALHSAKQIQDKLWGSTPEQMGNAINSAMEPPVTQQIDMLQGKVTELVQALESILKTL